MGTAEFKINGRKVSEIYFRNITTFTEPADDIYDYEYQVWRLGDPLVVGTVKHYRGDGVERLVATIIMDACPKGGA